MVRTLASITLIASTSTILWLQACNRLPIADVPVTQNVSFQTHIQPITSKVCIECHSKGDRDFSQYKNAFAYRYSIKDRVVLSKTMPLGKFLSDQDRALFRDWVDQGGNK